MLLFFARKYQVSITKYFQKTDFYQIVFQTKYLKIPAVHLLVVKTVNVEKLMDKPCVLVYLAFSAAHQLVGPNVFLVQSVL